MEVVVLNCWVTETKLTSGCRMTHDLGEVGQRSGQPVDLIDHHGIDLLRRNICQQLLQSGPLHVSAREAAVVVLGRDHLPSFMFLAQNISLARLSLRVKRIEGLVEAFLRRLAGVEAQRVWDRSRVTFLSLSSFRRRRT